MKFSKRQLVLAVLVVALGAAVYLNWQFADNSDLVAANTVASSTASEKELGAATYVNTQSETSSDTTSSNTSSATSSDTSSKLSTSATDYFASARLNRQQARDSANETLETTLNNTNITDEVKSSAVATSAEMANNIQQESNIENSVKAKGFADCIAFIENGQCNIAVATSGLLDSEAITIKDIAVSQTGLPMSNIKIIEVK